MSFRWGWAAACGVAAAVAAAAVLDVPLRLEPGAPVWPRCVRGAGPGGELREAVVLYPGLELRRGGTLSVELAEGEERAQLGAHPEGEPVRWAHLAPGEPGLWSIPGWDEPGLRLRLRTSGGEAARIRAIEIRGARSGWALPLTLGLGTGLAATFLLRLGPAGPALGLWLAGLASLAALPALLLWQLPAPGALLRVLAPFGLLAAAFAAGWRRPRFGSGAVLLAVAALGLWIRIYALPSAGSWDTDYWKAIAVHAGEHGVTRVYGGPDAVPPGRFMDQLQGREAIFEVEGFGRSFVVDQPPGIQALWAASWRLVRESGLFSRAEGQNVAAKLPPFLGDVLGVFVLLWAFPEDRRRGLALAAVHWLFPLAWLSGPVLGFFDGAQAPLAVAAVVAAGRGRALQAGALLAAAALVKATALIVLPAAVVALRLRAAPVGRAVAAGLLAVACALVPFAVDGTLDSAVIHVYRILFQERLSGGFPNLWWLASHALSLGVEGRGPGDPIPYVRIEAFPLPARLLGVALFGIAASYALLRQRTAPGPRAAALSAAALVFSYAMLAVGVHENHPHGLYLMLLATGLVTRRLQLLAAVLFCTASLDMLCLSGLGRFYGLRYAPIEGLARAVGELRMGLGVDLTLLLAVLNLLAFGAWLLEFRGALAAAAGTGENPPAS
jgi:hypothetical protein